MSRFDYEPVFDPRRAVKQYVEEREWHCVSCGTMVEDMREGPHCATCAAYWADVAAGVFDREDW